MRMERQDHAYVKLENVSKVYGSGEVKIVAVDHISFEINKGEFVVVVGPSGAGKTTVLNILGGMDKATSGHVLVADSLPGIGERILVLYFSFIIWCPILQLWKM